MSTKIHEEVVLSIEQLFNELSNLAAELMSTRASLINVLNGKLDISDPEVFNVISNLDEALANSQIALEQLGEVSGLSSEDDELDEEED